MTSRGPLLALALSLVACDGAGSPDAAPIVEDRALGMNDITMLLPLPTDVDQPTILKITDESMIWRGLFTGLVLARADIGPKSGAAYGFEDFHLVAIRFDLCNRIGVGPCRAGADGRLRLVLQPLYRTAGETFAHDVAIHAFYPIPAADLPDVVAELRALAAIQDAPIDGPLTVSPALSQPSPSEDYVVRLRSLVTRYARLERLVRLTVAGQDALSAAFAWIFRGADQRSDGTYALMVIPEVVAETQISLLAGGDAVFDTKPMADSPRGFALAVNGQTFASATADERRDAVRALSEIQNPTIHAPDSTQCVGCHIATNLLARRSASLGIDPTTLPTHYSSTYDTTVTSIENTDPRVIRGLGWAAKFPAISQRVANETAHVLTEIERRFPVSSR